LTLPTPGIWTSEAADVARDEEKRRRSPPSFFFAQSHAIELAAGYFRNKRLVAGAARGVASKHRHRIRAALFGQVMATFEFCVKDFVARLIDATDLFDDAVIDSKWIDINKSRVLAQREASGRVGALLVHPLPGWHDAESVNQRYRGLFGQDLVMRSEALDLDRLWILRHTVVHNAGFVTQHDAYRLRALHLSDKAIDLDPTYLQDTVSFLQTIVARLADPVGGAVLTQWFSRRATGSFDTDRAVYTDLKLISTVIRSRAQGLPAITEAMYDADRAAAA
jgi:hypothetical protein